MARKLVFLPGVGADQNFWRPLGERLPADRDKVYLGWPGLGHNPPDPAVNGHEDLLRLVEAAMGEGECDLLAQSMGGVLALAAALRRPAQVRRLVLAVTSGGVDVKRLGAIDWRETYRREYPNAASWIYEPWQDLTERIGEVRAPALLLFGDADPIAPVAVGERLAALLPGARLRVIVGGEHDLVEARAAEVAPFIEAHLA